MPRPMNKPQVIEIIHYLLLDTINYKSNTMLFCKLPYRAASTLAIGTTPRILLPRTTHMIQPRVLDMGLSAATVILPRYVTKEIVSHAPPLVESSLSAATVVFPRFVLEKVVFSVPLVWVE